MQRIGAPEPQRIGTLVHMSAGNNQVRNLRRLGLRSLANFEDVVVEKADDIHRAKHHGLPACLQREATNIEVVMNSSRNSVMAEAGNVNLAFMSIWRNDRFSRSGSELCLSLSKTERQRDHRKGNGLGKSSQVNRTPFVSSCAKTENNQKTRRTCKRS